MRAASRHPAAYRGTTHISVIDRDGNAAAASLSNGEGNGSIVGNFGFMLNNMLGEEDLTPDGLGKWRVATRLSSMMAPTIILRPDGTVIALGTGGSNRIRTAILQVAVNLLDHGMSLEDAVTAPRLHLEKCGTLSFEPGLPEAAQAVFRALEDKAHAWPEANLFFGGVHAARRNRQRRRGRCWRPASRRGGGCGMSNTMKKAIAISHLCFEDAGTLEDAITARGVSFRYLQAGVDDLTPAKDADILVVLGGPIGVYELDRYPFLKSEFAVIETVIGRGKPIVGICLGAQLIAAVLGGRVYPGREKEIGWGLLGLTP